MNHILHVLLGIVISMAFAANNTCYAGQEELESINYLLDADGKFTEQELLKTHQDWLHLPHSYLNLGFTANIVWIKFDIASSGQETTKLFEVANHKITDIALYVAQQQSDAWEIKQQIKVSDRTPVYDRVFPHRNFIFPITVPAQGNTTVLVRVESNYPMKLPMHLWDRQAFHQQDTNRILFQGLYFGSVLIMALYNLCIYFFVKDKSYATYVIFIVMFACVVAVDKGMATQYIWPNHPGNDFMIYVVLVAFGAASSVLFTIHFLSLKSFAPRFAKGFYGLITFWVVLGIYAVFKPSLWVLLIEMIVLIPGGIALFTAGVMMWRKGVAAAPYYTISWFMVIMGVLIYSANLLGLLPISLLTEYALQVGNILEAALLSLGLAHRIKALNDEKQSAYAMSKAKSEFLATMSHEIRTPMNGILGMAQLLKDTKLSQQQSGYLSTILGSGQTLLTVLNDILDYSKIEAGKLDIESIQFNIRRLVDETAGVFAVKATEKGVYYNTYVDPLVPIKIKGDPTRVRQILTNFLSNAFKFTHEGRVTIHVIRDSATNSLRFEVKDTGIGIKQEKLATVFEEFTQADSSTSRQFGGTGLGLPISKRLVEMMGGQIGVQSVVGEGSLFWFSLPITGEIPFDRIPDDKLHQEVSAYRFLLISPDQLFAEQVQAYSNVWGFGFAAQKSINMALKQLSPIEDPYDFIFVDQYCEDFSYEAVHRDLLSASWAKGSQLLLTMKPGSDRMAFEQMKPAPWIEEYPVSITRIQLRFLGYQGVKLTPQPADHLDHDFSNMRVLLVEDNPVNAKVAIAFLNKLGIQPKAVDSGEEALELVCHEKREFDLVLMDCEMPGIDGYTTTRHIRDWEIMHNRAPLNICALSAHAMDSHKNKCMDAGMNDFLTKPLVFDQLKNKILEAYQDLVTEAG